MPMYIPIGRNLSDVELVKALKDASTISELNYAYQNQFHYQRLLEQAAKRLEELT